MHRDSGGMHGEVWDVSHKGVDPDTQKHWSGLPGPSRVTLRSLGGGALRTDWKRSLAKGLTWHRNPTSF